MSETTEAIARALAACGPPVSEDGVCLLCENTWRFDPALRYSVVVHSGDCVWELARAWCADHPEAMSADNGTTPADVDQLAVADVDTEERIPSVDPVRLLREGIEAFRLTREYLWDEALPAIEGWSWFDWCVKAQELVDEVDGSTMFKWGVEELRRAGLYDDDSDYGGMMGEAVAALLAVFCAQRHSGFSAGLAEMLLGRLLRYEPLTVLTDDPDEWMQVEMGDEPCWQSRRWHSAFSNDGGKRYYDVHDPDRITRPTHPAGSTERFEGRP